MQTKLHWIRVF